MRDAHRIKEKLELSLDNRQVVSLLISGLVVLGAVFVLGVVVGKKLASNQATATAPDLLTALDHKATQFTFQDELTKKAPSEPPPKANAGSPPAAPVSVGSSKTELPGSPAAPIKELSTEVGEQKETSVPTRMAEPAAAPDLKKALTKAVKEPVLPKEAAAGGKFTLQLLATQTKEEAQRFLNKVRDRGYAPFLVEASVFGRGTWYRVRMGSFPTREAAARYLADFRRETQMEAFVTNN